MNSLWKMIMKSPFGIAQTFASHLPPQSTSPTDGMARKAFSKHSLDHDAAPFISLYQGFSLSLVFIRLDYW
jgi:hypothetical protein